MSLLTLTQVLSLPLSSSRQGESAPSEGFSEEVARRRLTQRRGRPEMVVERSRQQLLQLQMQEELRAREREINKMRGEEA